MSLLDEIERKAYFSKRNKLITKGLNEGLVVPYSVEFVENLRQHSYGGLPLSVILLCTRYCKGKCYDRALFATFGFGDDDFKLVDADIDSIKYSVPRKDRVKPHFNNHCFAVRTREDGSEWVYDTSVGLVFEKSFYEKIENPIVTKINNRSAVQSFIDYQDVLESDVNKDKLALPLILPMYESVVENDLEPIYKEALADEIALFKETIQYDKVKEEAYANFPNFVEEQ